GDARAYDAGDGDLDARLLGDAGRDADRRVQQALRGVGRHGDVQLVLLAGPARHLVLVAGRRDVGLDVGLGALGDRRLEGLLLGDQDHVARVGVALDD